MRIIDRMGSTIIIARDQKVFRKGQSARNIYKVESGCMRTYVYLNDGRRQIVSFYFPGDFFGLEMRSRHNVFAEAITPSVIRVIGKKSLTTRAATDLAVAKRMLHLTNVELQRTQIHSLLLRLPANERVGQFLFEMKKRNRSKKIDLLMTRYDIADYLSLTVETVSRAFTSLKKRSAISLLTRRRVAVRIRKALAA
jgi:CRP/FNR family transcriptional regulator, nitrogen fixation regulation protein